MNMRKVIDISSGRYPPATKGPEEKSQSPSADSEITAQHMLWLQHPQTNEFLDFLQQEGERLRQLGVDNACAGKDEHNIVKPLIKAKAIQEIINYARTKRTDGRDTATVTN